MKLSAVHQYPDQLTGDECRRCGCCCHVDMFAYVTDRDIARWQSEGRHDLVARASGGGLVWSGDTIVSSTGLVHGSCSFLNWDGNAFFCEIYESRPDVCRAYVPGSSELCPRYGHSS